MTKKDTYQTIREPSEGLYKEKGSRFLAFAFPVNNREDTENKVSDLRKKYHNARHHCYAYVLKPDQSEYRINDDGEPSNSAGQPILAQIKAHNLTNILVVVVRYFGGTLLGTGGLIRAYKTAAADAIHNASIVTATIREIYQLRYGYDLTGAVLKVVEDPGVKILDQAFDEQVRMEIGIRKSVAERVIKKLHLLQGLEIYQIDSG
jgi:uncharacterized YigZ family protein